MTNDVTVAWHYDAGDRDLEEKPRVVQDDSRTLTFTGVKLTGVSSAKPGRARWTNLDIYRTNGGLFVAYRTGMTTVAHDVSCVSISGRRLPGLEGVRPSDTPIVERTPCATCNPNIAKALEDPASLRFEMNRHWTVITSTAEELYRELHTVRRGVEALSYLARHALTQAAEHDAQISEIVDKYLLG